VPSDPFEAELLAMAGALVHNKESDSSSEEEQGEQPEELRDEVDNEKTVMDILAEGNHDTSLQADFENDIQADSVVPKVLPANIMPSNVKGQTPGGQQATKRRAPKRKRPSAKIVNLSSGESIKFFITLITPICMMTTSQI